MTELNISVKLLDNGTFEAFQVSNGPDAVALASQIAYHVDEINRIAKEMARSNKKTSSILARGVPKATPLDADADDTTPL